MRYLTPIAAIGALALTTATPALAEIKIGAILSLTGPAASLGIPSKNTLDLLPKTIDGEPVTYTVIDDASDPSSAVRAARKLMSEESVDVIFGPSITSTSLAVLEAIGPGKTPMISLAGSSIISSPVEGNKTWAFKFAPEESTMAHYMFENMKKNGDKTIGFIGFNDAFGDSFIGAFKTAAEKAGIEVIADERFARTDTSVTAQAASLIAAAPDAISIAASGTPGVAPIIDLRNLGYEGSIYINQGMANPDVLRVDKAALEGVMLPVSPALVAEQLPDDNPIKPVAVEYVTAYEDKYGEGSRSLLGASVWDAFLIVENAYAEAKTAGEPGTEAFRTGLRDAIESTSEFVGSQGIFTLSPTNHNGTDLRAQILVRIEDGKWVYMP